MDNVDKQGTEMNEDLKISVSGRVKITDVTDKDNPRVILEKDNAIHKGNFVRHLALSMAGKDHGAIQWMAFGDAGANGVNVNDQPTPGDALNRVTRGIVVNTSSEIGVAEADEDNNITVVSPTGSYSDIVILCTLGGSSSSEFIFSEFGLMAINPKEPENIGTGTGDSFMPNGILLSHVTFDSETKAAGATYQIEYTVRIQI